MFHKAIKAQFTFLAYRIDNLFQALSDYKLGEKKFPYSKLYDLHNDISAISNKEAKIELLVRLNNEVVSRLLQYNPKIFSYYKELEQEIFSFSIEPETSGQTEPSVASLNSQ
ncbi:hypothetical protein [Legionella rowbothamii]|uniref:hypothetical protein n=1 Tax=Legionella rowbothamii TaxID=96229 RepID=UPI0010566F5B|nr:hypothetical protein [Legionella rowbothamii]